MECSNKLADLHLVSKYYPVANYSYPRNEQNRARSPTNRSSLGSEGSAPGLIDDRTDSEVSVDDDYQYHSNTAEIWDSFWQREEGARKLEAAAELNPRKQYPALIPSPQHRRRNQLNRGLQQPCPAWPLPESNGQPKTRKPAATYSPFPKTAPVPPRTTSLAPPQATTRSAVRPIRPPRPDSSLRPCIRTAPVNSTFTTSEGARLSRDGRPRTSMENFPALRPSTSFDVRPTTPFQPPSVVRKAPSFCTTTTTHQTHPERTIPRLAPPEPEPHSVFEYDDDSDSEESHSRSFFRFHKRSDSDNRRTPRASEASGSGRRARAKTAPSSPTRPPLDGVSSYECTSTRKRQPDVLSRMLGRRSR